MRPIQSDLLKKLGILMAMIILALATVSCGSDDPVAPPQDEPEENRAPGAPIINTSEGTPSDGATNVPLTTTLHWSCTDPDGDALIYTLHFGSTDTPPELLTNVTGTSHGPMSMAAEVTFYWQVVALDPDGETTASPVWSFTTAGEDLETISYPANPTGLASPAIGVESTYTTSGATSSEGHAVEYQFNWGDGTSSDWASAASADHAWTAGGTYSVTAQARCAEHTDILSGLSGALTVTVEGGETISTPNAADGPLTGISGGTQAYNLSGATSSLGHTVEYRVEWTEGLISTWSTQTVNRSFFFSEAGTYNVRVQARCQDHPEVESAWSEAIVVTISDPEEYITGGQIYTPTAPSIGGIGDVLEFQSYIMHSNLGHQLEYRYDWDDGTFSDWLPNGGWNPASHAWSAAGVYQVRIMGRCIEHPAVETEWSEAHEVEIFAGEVVAVPTFSPSEEQYIEVMAWTGLSVPLGDTSNMGHPLEYQYDPGDGRDLVWDPSFSVYVRYDALGDYEARVRARCREHTDIVSDWSPSTLIHVVEPGQVSTPTISGPTTGTVGVPVEFTVSDAESSLGYDLEYQLSYGMTSGTANYYPQGWTTADNLSITWNTGNPNYYVIVTARCIDLPAVMAVSSYMIVNISE